jgi:hypothetical protein
VKLKHDCAFHILCVSPSITRIFWYMKLEKIGSRDQAVSCRICEGTSIKRKYWHCRMTADENENCSLCSIDRCEVYQICWHLALNVDTPHGICSISGFLTTPGSLSKVSTVLYRLLSPMTVESLRPCKSQPYGKWFMPSWVHILLLMEVYAVGRDSVTEIKTTFAYKLRNTWFQASAAI